MFLPWNRFAVVAALVAVQAGLTPSLAGSSNASEEESFMSGLRQGMALSKFFNSSFFEGGNFSSLFDGFGPVMRFFSSPGGAVKLYVRDEDEKACQLQVEAPSSVDTADIRLTLDPAHHSLTASFHSEQNREHRDPEKGNSFSSRSFRGSSTIYLPMRCVASAAVLIYQLGGALFARERKEGQRVGIIVLPSKTLLSEYTESNLLPEGVLAAIEKGEDVNRFGLNDSQLCLVSGFTSEQCEKLDNRKPEVASVPVPDAASPGMPVPVYNAHLEMLD